MSRSFLRGIGASMAGSSVVLLISSHQVAMLLTLFISIAIVAFNWEKGD